MLRAFTSIACSVVCTSVVCTGIGAGSAYAADNACVTFDRTPMCCPHPPPQCCPAPTAAPLDDALVQSVCGPSTVKGQSFVLDECKRYYARGDDIGEVVFGRQAGDAAALAKIRAALVGTRAQVADVSVSGAKNAFVMRALTERGVVERIAIWGVVGAELVHLEADVSACKEPQVQTLLDRALGRMRKP